MRGDRVASKVFGVDGIAKMYDWAFARRFVFSMQ